MKIVHLCLGNFYSDGYSYQENEITKFHQQLGYEVEIIASHEIYDSKGQYTLYDGPADYENEYGIPVHRLAYRDPQKAYFYLRRYRGLKNALEKARPQIIFIHGCQFSDINIVADYLKSRPGIKVYVDNHADLNNSAQSFLSKNILHKIIWKRCAHLINPYTTRFYGVTPSRVDFLTDIYKLPAEKCALLAPGADDDLVAAALKPAVRADRRKAYGVSEDDFVIVTGGKIDRNKPQVLTLMKAVGRLGDKHIKLIVFGSVIDELKEDFEKSVNDTVKYIGWRKSDEIYEDFAAADLVAFPGLHSVLWEQAAGMGKPCVFRRIEGFGHIDLGGNCLFFEDDSADSYAAVIRRAVENADAMKAVAEEKGKAAFSYRGIAKRALEG